MNSLIDVRMWLSTFELANPGLGSREMGLACICLLEDPVMAAIAQYLPNSYRYSDVRKALLRVFDSKAKDYIDRDNFMEYKIKSLAEYPDEFRQMVARLQQKDLINVNDARRSLRHSLLSQFPKLWTEFSGQINGLNNLSDIVDQVYTLPNLQAQLAKYRTEGSSRKVFYSAPEGREHDQPYHERPGYDGCFICQSKEHVMKDCPYYKAFQKVQGMNNGKSRPRYGRDRKPGVRAVIPEENAKEEEESDEEDPDTDSSKN